jgi:hypothetical protein
MRGRLLVLVAAVAVLLAGCKLDVQVDVAMDGNGAGSITVTATADADLVAQAPGLADDLRLDDLTAAGWTVDGPSPTDAGGLRVSLTHVFASADEATALLASLNGSGGPFQGLTLTRVVDGKKVTYDAAGALQVTGGLDAFSDQQVQALGAGTPFADALARSGAGLADALNISLQMQLPTSIDSTNGTQDGTTVSWQVPLDGSATPVQATAVSNPSSGAKRLLAVLAFVVFAAWVILAGAFLIYVVRQRQRRPA